MENQKLTCIGFDADDTLWHNEQFFQITQQYLKMLLADFCEADHLSDRLLEAEKRNLKHFGFGVKGFTLSMIETAIEVSGGKVPAEVIGEILKAGKDMLSAPVQLLPHAGETLEALAGDYTIVLITKGDLFDQERKLAQSGLGDFFNAVEIVSDKNPDAYLSAHIRRTGGMPGKCDDGRQFAQVGCHSGIGYGGLGRSCSPRDDMGAGTRRETFRAEAFLRNTNPCGARRSRRPHRLKCVPLDHRPSTTRPAGG